MVYKKNLHELEFETIEQYFEYIVDSIINGQRSQANQLISDLSKKQKKDFIDWTEVSFLHENEYFQEASRMALVAI